MAESNYHLQFTPAYRRAIFRDPLTRELIISYIAQKLQQHKVVLIAYDFGPDHLHLFVGNVRFVGEIELVRQVKGYSSYMMRNGDVFSPEQFVQKLYKSGVDTVMIGRGAIGNPYLFKQILDYQKKGSYLSPDKAALFSEYLEIACKYRILFPAVKQHAIWFIKGMSNAPGPRMMISGCNNVEEIIRVYQEYS